MNKQQFEDLANELEQNGDKYIAGLMRKVMPAIAEAIQEAENNKVDVAVVQQHTVMLFAWMSMEFITRVTPDKDTLSALNTSKDMVIMYGDFLAQQIMGNYPAPKTAPEIIMPGGKKH